MQQHQRGFTLIELIIVIVILGILAVTAAPKFIDITSDAKGATLQAVKGSLQSAGQMVYGKSAIKGQQANTWATGVTPTSTSFVKVNGIDLYTSFGYPHAASITALTAVPATTDLSTIMSLESTEWVFVTGTAAGAATAAKPALNSFAISPKGVTVDYTSATSCHVVYQDAADKNTPPVITIVSGGC